MGLFKKKHKHSGKAQTTRKIDWHHGTVGAGLPYKWTTEVAAICEDCGQPFIVEYDGVFDKDMILGVVIKEK